MKNYLLLIFSLSGPVFVSIGGLTMAHLFRGKNFSDVGVPVYSHGELMFYVVSVLYFTGSGLILYLMYRNSRKSLILISGIPFTIVYFIFFQYILRVAVSF